MVNNDEIPIYLMFFLLLISVVLYCAFFNGLNQVEYWAHIFYFVSWTFHKKASNWVKFQDLLQVVLSALQADRLCEKKSDFSPSHSFSFSFITVHSGYQRQLTYKRQDGSYSAFGERDSSGSMWWVVISAAPSSLHSSQRLNCGSILQL